MNRGIIFSIEEFGVNDGPGIRTVIFLKGCPLRCAWCHNPEGISFKPQYMEKKTGRMLCGYTVDAADIAEKILRNRDIFEMCGGGITLSGGEPLAQHRFVEEFLQQTASLHRAIETSGYAPPKTFRTIVDLVDLVLMDVKLMDSAKHKQYTGVDNHRILKNLDYLCTSGKNFVVRIPLIPGVNDDASNMQAVLSALKGAKSLQRVELMRYNKLAGAKYPMIGREYHPPFDPAQTPYVTDIFEKHQIPSIVLQ
ncbi:MAG: radical SAM protein [Bacteroidales bacterium]|nr:radical SAM protein [Bacteroidales bacterium]